MATASAAHRSGLANPPSMVDNIFSKSWTSAASTPSSHLGIPDNNPNLFSDLIGSTLNQGGSAANNVPLQTAILVTTLTTLRWCSYNVFSTQDKVTTILASSYLSPPSFASYRRPRLVRHPPQPSLAVLDFHSAAVSNVIPFSLGRAAGLSVLSLARNSFTSDIPATLNGLRLLTLDLSSNDQVCGDRGKSFSTSSRLH